VSAVVNVPMVPASKLKELGVAAGHRYVEHKGTEYVVSRAPTSSEYSPPRRGEIVITSSEELVDEGGYRTVRQLHHRGEPVESGTYAALAAKGAKPKPREAPLRVWDAVAQLPAFQHRDPVRIPTRPPDGNPLLGQLRGMLGTGSSDVVEVLGNEPPARSAAGYIRHLRERGVLLDVSPHGNRLVVKSRRPVGLEDKALIALTEELLIGELSGRRVMCAFDDGLEAVTIAYPRLPVCEPHARGE
jgi:hypothetical protein